nr:sugar ABC transporter permease [Chloroflexaceae bacterium]
MQMDKVQTLPSPSFLQNLQRVLRQNVRDYGMFIALFVIMAIFTVTTNGVFLSPRNLSNLLNQTGYIAVLAVGMTLVIVIRQIDLSVGFLAGFLGAVAAIALVSWGMPTLLVVPMVLGFGLLAGLITAFPVAQLGIPSFVASLAGWLIYRGMLQLSTEGTGTINISDEAFNAIGNAFIPDIPNIGILDGVHKLSLLIGVVAIVLFVWGEINSRRKQQAYNF